MTLGTKFNEIDKSIKENTAKINELLEKIEKLIKALEKPEVKGKK